MTSLEVNNQKHYNKIATFLKEKSKGEELELEARFGDIGIKQYNSLKKDLDEKYGKSSETSFQTDYKINNIRNTITETSKGLYTISQIEKKELWSIVDETFGYKLSLSSEKMVSIPEESNVDQHDIYLSRSSHTRKKYRTSYQLEDGDNSVKIDLTRVITVGKNNYSKTTYEVESELVGEINPKSIEFMDKIIFYLVSVLRSSSAQLYSDSERLNVINSYNTIMKAPASSKINSEGKDILSHAVLSQARNLKRSDCVYGKIVSKDKYKYTITQKANGERKVMIFNKLNLWMIYPPYDFNLVIRSEQLDEDYREIFKSLEGTIFDGEDIPKSERVGLALGNMNKVYYIPFDCMAIRGDIKIQNNNLDERQKYMINKLKMFESFGNPFITVNFKTFLLLEEPEYKSSPTNSHIESIDFFSAIDTLEKEREKLPFTTDGYLITPYNSKYYTNLDNIELHKRSLDVNPEICKIKPWEELTIDFVYNKTDDDSPYLTVNRRNTDKFNKSGKYVITPVEFTGTNFSPFDKQVNVNWEHEMFKDIVHGNIVEMGPTKRDDGTIVLEPRKIRYDKSSPNGETIANSVWDDINRPLRIDTLRGKTFDLLRQYHNRVKKNLITELPNELDVIDIGFGNGADIDKYRGKYKNFLAIEPNTENIAEAKRRIGKHKDKQFLEENIKIIQTGGEDPKIVEEVLEHFKWKEGTVLGRDVVISMMLSLSFFFGDNKLHSKLEKNIKNIAKLAIENGASKVYLIGLTIDGDEVKRVFDNKSGLLDLGETQLTYDGDKTVNINMDNSIVTNQVEYLVRLREFIDNLGYIKKSISKVDKEKLLSDNEKIFTSMYKSFKVLLRKSKEEEVKVHIEEEIPLQYNKRVILEDKNLKYVVIDNNDPNNSIFESCMIAIGSKLSGFDARVAHHKWLTTESKFPPEMILLEYGFDPVPAAYKGSIKPNINYYTIKELPISYDDKLKSINNGDGIGFITAFLASGQHMEYNILDLLGYSLGVYIVIRDQNLNVMHVLDSYDEKAKKITIIRHENGIYSPMALDKGYELIFYT